MTFSFRFRFLTYQPILASQEVLLSSRHENTPFNIIRFDDEDTTLVSLNYGDA